MDCGALTHSRFEIRDKHTGVKYHASMNTSGGSGVVLRIQQPVNISILVCS